MIVYGRNVTIESLKSEYKVNGVWIDEQIGSSEKVSEILELCKEHNIVPTTISRKKLTKLIESDEHQGVACDINFKYADLSSHIKLNSQGKSKSTSYIYITEAHYEHNVGAIIRSAEVAGFAGVIIPSNINITATTVKTSVGAIFNIPIFKYSINNAINLFKQNKFAIFGIERDGTPYYFVDLSTPSLYIIGGEDKSISENVREECDAILEIPQFGKVNSLNMSVAASIVMFEHAKQRTIANL